MKNYIRDESKYFLALRNKKDVTFTCSVSKEQGIPAPPPLSEQEKDSEEPVSMKAPDPSYEIIFKSFLEYFTKEANELNDSKLNDEMKLMENILSEKDKRESSGSVKEENKNDLSAHKTKVAKKTNEMKENFKPLSEGLPSSADVCFLMDCTGSMGSWIAVRT